MRSHALSLASEVRVGGAFDALEPKALATGGAFGFDLDGEGPGMLSSSESSVRSIISGSFLAEVLAAGTG